jgi:hypothetical protein
MIFFIIIFIIIFIIYTKYNNNIIKLYFNNNCNDSGDNNCNDCGNDKMINNKMINNKMINNKMINNKMINNKMINNNDNDKMINNKMINNIINLTIQQANINSYPIIFNPSLKPIEIIDFLPNEIENIYNRIIKIMNSVCESQDIFSFISIENQMKEKMENQIKLSFYLNLIYNNLISLKFNIILLFEKIFQNEDDFYKNNNTSVNTFLSDFSLIII